MLNKMTKNIFYQKNFPYYMLLVLLVFTLFLAITMANFTNRHTRNQAVIDYISLSVEDLDSMFEENLYHFMRVNLEHYIKQSTFGQFFTDNRSDSDFFTKIRISAIDSMRLQQNLKSLILYRAYDSALISTMSVRTDFKEGNPAYTHVISAITSDMREVPGFISSSEGDVFYYYPLHMPSSSNELLGCAMVQLRSPQSFFDIQISELNPNGTFIILSHNRPVYVQGSNILSTEAITNMIQTAPPSNRLLTYSGPDMPPYNFYRVPSRTGQMVYIYYEPASKGLLSLRQLLSADWILPFAWAIASVLLFFAVSVYLTARIREEKNSSALAAAAVPIVLPMKEMTAEKLFPGTALPHFSGILIEYSCGSDIDPIQQQTNLHACCEQYLSGCRIAYRIIPHSLYICCYLSYSLYNMRVLSDSLKQTLYNSSGHSCRFAIYYTRSADSVPDMLSDMLFLQHSLCYTQMLGYGKRYSSEVIRECCKSMTPFAENVVPALKKLLSEKKYDEAIAYLTKQSEKIRNLGTPDCAAFYSYESMYYFAESSFFAIKDYFLDKSFSHPLTSQNTAGLLQTHAGLDDFCGYLAQSIEDYKSTNEQTSTAHEKQFMEAVYLYIDQNLISVSLTSMAEHFHITPAHLSRLFKKNTDQNFSEYLLEKKLAKAILLLENSGKSINEISRELGYSTPAYFLTKFKERYGITPSAYRKNHMVL